MSKKGTKALASATLMSLVLTTALSAGPVKAAAGQAERIGASDRYATAAQVATKNWTSSENVVLVSGEGYADAVSASALAKKLNAPILLTTAGTLSTDTASALSKLGAKNVYVVGGEASVSTAVRNELKKTYSLVELGGANRYETNVAVAQKLVDLGVDPSNVVMVGGEGFSDALSVAPVAAAKGQILLLGMNNADYMKPVLDFVAKNKSKVTVVGTKNVISDAILNTVGGTRVDGGKDRWDTNQKVLAAFKDTVKMDKLYVASAAYNAQDNGYADALVASALAGKYAAPLVLVDKDGNEGTTNALSYIKNNAKKTTDLQVVGGTGVVSDALLGKITAAVTPSNPSTGDVQSIEALNTNQFKVVFNQEVDEDTAETVANYKIDGVQLVKADKDSNGNENRAVATLQDDKKTVIVTLLTPRKQFDEVNVTVKKAILTADRSVTVSSFDQKVTFSDTTAPTLKSVTAQGNKKLTVEFSEAVNMIDVNTIASKIKVNGQSISNYAIRSDLSELKDGVGNEQYTGTSVTTGATIAYGSKVEFYFDSALPAGNNTLKVSDGVNNGILQDGGKFTFKESTMDFTVDTATTAPVVEKVTSTADGKIFVKFNRQMDKDTALNPAYYSLNGDSNTLSGLGITRDNMSLEDNDYTVKIKGLSGKIKENSNVLYITDDVEDAFGNSIDDDTRVSFTQVKDDTKPTVTSVNVIDSSKIRVRFSKDVKYTFATNKSNYKLKDSDGLEVTIDRVKAANDLTSDTDTYDIELSGANKLTGSKYTLTIKNIEDLVSTPNVMDESVTTITGSDDVAPRATNAVKKSDATNKVVVYFSEEMDSDSITKLSNYQFKNGEGDFKDLPSSTKIDANSGNKSVTIEFPTSYTVRMDQSTNTSNSNDVIGLTVANVKDAAGNVLEGVAKNFTTISNPNTVDGAVVKANSFKMYMDGNNLKAEMQFDRAIDTAKVGDFRVAGQTPDSISVAGDKVTLMFIDGKASSPVTTSGAIYGGAATDNATMDKIAVIKYAGIDAKLQIVSNDTVDMSGAKIKTTTPVTGDINVYSYQVAPKTKGKYFSGTTAGTVVLTFDSKLDSNSGVKVEDFMFIAEDGTNLEAKGVSISENTVTFTFDKAKSANNGKTYADYFESGDKVSVRAKSTVQIRTAKDLDGGYNNYKPSTDDLNGTDRVATVK